MKKIKFSFLFLGTLLIFACDPNSEPKYGDTGLPKNCRAIIQANVDGWRLNQYSAEDALASIERNCGANGYSWSE